ncbi:hypothetical protein V5R04_02500 [Jonesiaceae bacterium BS-20]|uniref:Lipoprotein n=1 Tax=Jonesiaceae bacterium BS-20 TaxID=3120821 RepID=A0AAU7DWN0_9MICO
MDFRKNVLSKLVAAGGIAALSLSLVACGSSGPQEQSVPTPTVAQTEPQPEVSEEDTNLGAESEGDVNPQAPESEEGEQDGQAATERQVVINISGAKSSALVKTLVITNDGKEQGGKMITQSLPFTQEVALATDNSFTKILVIAKYKDGQTGTLDCSIEIDGEVAATDSTTSHRPAECLVIEK